MEKNLRNPLRQGSNDNSLISREASRRVLPACSCSCSTTSMLLLGCSALAKLDRFHVPSPLVTAHRGLSIQHRNWVSTPVRQLTSKTF